MVTFQYIAPLPSGILSVLIDWLLGRIDLRSTHASPFKYHQESQFLLKSMTYVVFCERQELTLILKGATAYLPL